MFAGKRDTSNATFQLGGQYRGHQRLDNLQPPLPSLVKPRVYNQQRREEAVRSLSAHREDGASSAQIGRHGLPAVIARRCITPRSSANGKRTISLPKIPNTYRNNRCSSQTTSYRRAPPSSMWTNQKSSPPSTVRVTIAISARIHTFKECSCRYSMSFEPRQRLQNIHPVGEQIGCRERSHLGFSHGGDCAIRRATARRTCSFA